MPQELAPAATPPAGSDAAALFQQLAERQAAAQAERAAAQAEQAGVQAARAAAAGAPSVVVLPRTAREVEGLKVRRNMLGQQLEGAEERRQELTNALQRVGDPEEGRSPDQAAVALTRTGLEVRLKEADARVLQLERDIASTDRALTQATPEVLAQYEQQRPREVVHQGMEDEGVVAVSALSFLAGIMILVIGRRVRRWRRRGEREPFGAPAGVGPDPRIDRLTQAVDAIAVEVERIGEGQRFVTQLMAERRGLVPGDVERTLDVPGVR